MRLITSDKAICRLGASSVKFIYQFKNCLPFFGGMALLSCAVALAGCQRQEIKVYTAPKDIPSQAPMTAQEQEPAADPHAQRPRPQVSYTVPKGWKETGAGRMSVADFDITGEGGKQANVSITQLGNLQGKDAILVNMFRVNFGMKELSDEETARELKSVDLGGETGKFFEITGKRDVETSTGATNSEVMSVVTAFVHHPDGTWFYRLAGDPALVEQQKPVFLDFLKTIKIKEGATAASQPEPVASNFNWQVPKGWKVEAAGQMQVARFAVGAPGSKAEVFVSVFPSDTGGTLANVNRWRRQLGLQETDESQLSQLVSQLDPNDPQSMLVDMSNGTKRLLGAVVPRNGQYWFYKLLGDSGVVGPEKDNFVAFAKSNP
jgi:hypothetical protein